MVCHLEKIEPFSANGGSGKKPSGKKSIDLDVSLLLEW